MIRIKKETNCLGRKINVNDNILEEITSRQERTYYDLELENTKEKEAKPCSLL
jgi:hypothetical protein